MPAGKSYHTYNQQDWALFVPTATDYIKKYGDNLKPEEKKLFSEAIEKNK